MSKNPDREPAGLSSDVRRLQSLTIGDVEQGNYTRLRLLTSNQRSVALALSDIVQSKESPTEVFWVCPDDLAYTIEGSNVHFKVFSSRKPGWYYRFVVDAPRDIAIAKEEQAIEDQKF